ncbi:MAG: TonB-dependent receptor [Opitutaceae bacterium]
MITNTLAPVVSLLRPFVRIAVIALAVLSLPARAADGGTITGNVNNIATRKSLEGAKVEIPQLGLTTLSDNLGDYALTNVPAGTHEVVVTYLGLDPAKSSLTVTAGQRAVRNFDLTSNVYTLDTFKVSGEREGNAAMITEKKNASNIKDVIAMDSFGNLPNMSTSEVVRLLPGVTGSPTDEGLNGNLNIRGIGPGSNTVTVDGGSIASYGSSRNFELQSINTSLFEAVEVIKGQTPDKSADSLGAAINFKTASTLKMREDQRTIYNVSSRWAPPFLEQTPTRSAHRYHPLFNITHQRVFDVLGGKRNLGASLSAFYSENPIGGFEGRFNRTNGAVAPIYQYRSWDNTNNRKQQSLSGRLDFEYSPTSKFSFTVTENENIEHLRRRNYVQLTSGNNTQVPGVGTSQISPLSTNAVTIVNAAASNAAEVRMEGPIHYDIANFSSDFTGSHTYDRLTIDYSFRISRSKIKALAGRGAVLTLQLFDPTKQTVGQPVVFGGAGWIIDQTKDEIHPTVTQNGGPDITNPYNYMPITNGLSGGRDQAVQSHRQFRLDTLYKVPVSMPMTIKTGYAYRMQETAREQKDMRRWTFNSRLRYDPSVVTGRVLDEPTYVSLDRQKSGLAIPFFQTIDGNVKEGFPANPALWTEDRYEHYRAQYANEQTLNEYVLGYYTQIQGKFGRDGFLNRLGYLAGIRWENVRNKGVGYVIAKTSLQSSAAERLADPAAAAAKDYKDGLRVINGSYWQNFPSVHTFYDITPNLKVRASYSTSYGRPGTGNLFPGETIDDTNLRVTRNNPDLKPNHATNWDTTLEYYFEPVGSLTVSWFHKTITDYINTNQVVGMIASGQDNGFDGQYGGYELRTSLNGGSLITQGWEFGYNQQFTFLPGVLKGLSGTANYTWLDTHGYSTGTVYQNKNEIAGFIPSVYNLGLNWRYRKFGLRAQYNHTSSYMTGNNANPNLRQFRFALKTLQGGISYQYKPAVNFTLDVSNALGHDQRWWQGDKATGVNRIVDNFITLTVGMNGRF